MKSSNHDAVGVDDAVRTAVRFPLHLAMHLKTEAGTVDAITHDISSSGLLFSMPRLFSTSRLAGVGSVIEFSLDMPSNLVGWVRDVSIDCVGRVMRHQFKGEEMMMAAEIDQYSLRSQI
jgi:hypothetical protein